MAKSTDVVILGSGLRGLWLSTELVKLGWKVTWIQVWPQNKSKIEGFTFDDWAWQLGPKQPHSKVIQATKEFIDEVIRPETQRLSTQIITPKGPFEFSGGAENNCFSKFFGDFGLELQSFLKCLVSSNKNEDPNHDKLLMAHASKIFASPFGKRWVLEWLGGLRRSRGVTTKEWIFDWGGEILDPTLEFWTLKESLTDITNRAMVWAHKKGVDVKMSHQLSDIGLEGSKVTGIELHGTEGYLLCQHLVLSCSYQTIEKKLPRFAKHLDVPFSESPEEYIWIRCGFSMKPNSKPAGLEEFSTFVIDPNMPLSGSNLGIMKWRVGETSDSLTVWVRISYLEHKRRSYLTELADTIQRHLVSLFPRFDQNLVAVLPFEEYFKLLDVSHDDMAIVFKAENKFISQKSKLKNVWLAGPRFDRGLELLSKLATEQRLLGPLSELRAKELKRDRKIHSTSHGATMGSGDTI